MQQVILLEKPDLDAIKGGHTLTLNVGGATVMIGYAGRQFKAVGKVEGEFEPKAIKAKMNGNNGRHHQKVPCKVCKKPVAPQGQAPHMAMHKRNGDMR